jgi:hypothetical protein
LAVIPCGELEPAFFLLSFSGGDFFDFLSFSIH